MKRFIALLAFAMVFMLTSCNEDAILSKIETEITTNVGCIGTKSECIRENVFFETLNKKYSSMEGYTIEFASVEETPNIDFENKTINTPKFYEEAYVENIEVSILSEEGKVAEMFVADISIYGEVDTNDFDGYLDYLNEYQLNYYSDDLSDYNDATLDLLKELPSDQYLNTDIDYTWTDLQIAEMYSDVNTKTLKTGNNTYTLDLKISFSYLEDNYYKDFTVTINTNIQ